jgi:hypothetical protein
VAEADLAAVLADVGAVNVFFAVAPPPPGPGLRPVADLADPGLLAAEVERTRAALAAASGTAPDRVEDRVAASLFFQGLASRLLSPVLGAAVAHGRTPDPAGLRWRPDRDGPLSFTAGGARALTLPAAGPGGRAAAAADLVGERVVDGVLAPVAAALRARTGVAGGLLWGDAASALAGAAAAFAAARPGHAPVARAAARHLLARPPLRGLGAFAPDPPHAFVRTTCCLYYRLPAGGMCGDCALRPRP